MSASDLRERFGHWMSGLVLAVSDDDRITGYANRKAALRQQVSGAGEEALSLFAADKLSKLRELRREDGRRSRGQRHAQSAPRYACAPPQALSTLVGPARGTPTPIAARARTPRRARRTPTRANDARWNVLSSDRGKLDCARTLMARARCRGVDLAGATDHPPRLRAPRARRSRSRRLGDLQAADTVRGVPTIGATATRMSWICSIVTPASTAGPTCKR